MDSKGFDFDRHDDASVDSNTYLCDDTGQLTSSPPDKQEGVHLSSRLQSLSSLRKMNSMKKNLESYHENMFGFFGLSLQPTVYEDDATDDIHLPPAQQKADEMAKIKERARQRLLADMVGYPISTTV
jgi:hypothetical protein